MKIAATENYLCRIIKALGYESNLVGIPESFEVQNNEENEDQIDNQNEIQIIDGDIAIEVLFVRMTSLLKELREKWQAERHKST